MKYVWLISGDFIAELELHHLWQCTTLHNALDNLRRELTARILAWAINYVISQLVVVLLCNPNVFVLSSFGRCNSLACLVSRKSTIEWLTSLSELCTLPFSNGIYDKAISYSILVVFLLPYVLQVLQGQAVDGIARSHTGSKFNAAVAYLWSGQDFARWLCNFPPIWSRHSLKGSWISQCNMLLLILCYSLNTTIRCANRIPWHGDTSPPTTRYLLEYSLLLWFVSIIH